MGRGLRPVGTTTLAGDELQTHMEDFGRRELVAARGTCQCRYIRARSIL